MDWQRCTMWHGKAIACWQRICSDMGQMLRQLISGAWARSTGQWPKVTQPWWSNCCTQGPSSEQRTHEALQLQTLQEPTMTTRSDKFWHLSLRNDLRWGVLGIVKDRAHRILAAGQKMQWIRTIVAYLCIMCEHNYVNKQMPADWANFDSLWNEYRWNDYRDEGLKYIRKIQKISSNPWAHYTILHIKLFISTFARRYMAISGTSTGGTVPYKDMWSHILVVYRLHTGFFKITTILSNSWRRNLHAPFPPSQCCYIALLGKAFKKTAIAVRMPACIGQQHWSRGRGGIRCDVTTCRRIAVFFKSWEKMFFTLWMCKHKLIHKLGQIPFASAKTSIQNNPNTLSSSKLLPTKQRSNIAACAPHVGNNWRSEAVCLDVSCMVH